MLDSPKTPPPESPSRASSGLLHERVLEIHHYTDKLFSFKTTRTSSFRFQSGQFTMIGLEVNGRPLLRAYSMTNAVYDDNLEFFSIKVPDGPLTSKLQNIAVGDTLLVGTKPTGTLIIGNLKPARRLLLLATGTGFAPFASILRDPETYDMFETVIAVEGCRQVAELEYATQVVVGVRSHEYLGDMAKDKLHYYATATREPYHHQGRIPDLIENGKLFADLGLAPLDLATDRVMMCGNPQMLASLKALLAMRGFTEGNSGTPGDYVIEKAFVER
ncbi:MAG: ferredoxin--NADP reductase [Hyphomicrobium sp.]|nr:ferredoxin--NADP reductase [Hyphomicrobium sp.]